MTHIARLLLFSTLLLSPVGSTLVAAADEPLGVLVVAHGSTPAWNATVEDSVAIIRQHTPSQVAYLMGANNRTPQEAYDDLVAAGVQRVVIVPLLVSSHSSHYEQIRFIGRLRDDYPGSDWMSLTPLHGPADVVGTQVLAKLVFTASPGNVWRAAHVRRQLQDRRIRHAERPERDRHAHRRAGADQTDPVFIASLKSEAADFADGAVSPKVGAAVRVTDVVTVHAQYARGFRAPPTTTSTPGSRIPRAATRRCRTRRSGAKRT